MIYFKNFGKWILCHPTSNFEDFNNWKQLMKKHQISNKILNNYI